MSIRALGRLLDLSVGSVPYDSNAGASTGKRVSLRNCGGITVVVYKGAGVGTDDLVLTVKEATAASGGTLQNITAGITEYHKKEATTLAGTETWTRVTQAASASITLTSSATKQGIYVFEVEETSLSDTFAYLEVDVADSGAAGAELAAVLFIQRDLEVQRTPANLVASLA